MTRRVQVDALPCECEHGEERHWFYRESCLDCDCGRYFRDGELTMDDRDYITHEDLWDEQRDDYEAHQVEKKG